MHRNNPFMYFRLWFQVVKWVRTRWLTWWLCFGGVQESGPLPVGVWEVEAAHRWVFGSAYGYTAFFNLRWIKVTSKASEPSFSLILFAQFVYNSAPLPSCLVSPRFCNQFHTVFLSKPLFCLPFYPLSCQSISISCSMYSHLDLPLPAQLNLSHWCFAPHLSLAFSMIISSLGAVVLL